MSKHSLINLKEIFPESVEDFFTPWGDWFRKNSSWLSRTTIPALNVHEEKDHYLVTVAAPGLEKEDFNIEIDNNIITISASAEKEHEEEKKKYSRREYSYSSFSRSFTLPSDVNADSINATYEKGILSLTLPKKEEVREETGKKITIK